MIGLGCMRLSTAEDRDVGRATEVIAASIAAGVEWLDTADAYAHDDADIGHSECLIGAVLASTSRRPRVVTKGGLVRPDGAWVTNGRARHLDASARASRDRLGVDAIDLYLLHAVDPRTPLATSVRALARLRDAGVAREIGLSNVNVSQLDEALALTAIDAIEIELSPYKLAALHGGLVKRCHDRGIRVIAHRPLGGPAGVRRLEKDATVVALAADLGVTPIELALAWLRSLGVIPIPGATRVETARSIGCAGTLDPAVAAPLDVHFGREQEPRGPAPVLDQEREVVILMGMPAAGKSTLAADFVARGYLRLNRDDRGGTLAALAGVLGQELQAGAARVVLDNTYGTRASRAQVLAAARRHGVRVRCVVMTTSLEQAQANAVSRILTDHGRLLEPDELRRTGAIAPSVQFRYRRNYEPPQLDEGLAAIEEVSFRPRAEAPQRRAVIVELDDLVWRSRPRSPNEVELAPGMRDRIAAFAAAGYLVAGTTWQTPTSVDARLAELLGLPIVVVRCAHPAGPPVCWCRKPLPGLALALARAHGIDLARSVVVGRGPADRGFALRAGVSYADVVDGFPEPRP